ncbi:MAG TPA: CdaR family protein [Thermomicrobiaceae bacterium]|nr:CdaR family protein [Thermomicrobiaceae bacterium]
MRPGRRPAWVRLRHFFDRGNIARAVVSLILAFLLWAWVTAENNPQVNRLIGGIQVSAINLSDQLQVESQLPTVDIRIEGPRDELNTLDPLRIQATVDLGDLKQPGTLTVPVHVTVPGHLRVREVAPSRITVTVGHNGTK